MKYFVDTIAGGGKTYAAIDVAADQARKGRKIVIAQPSRDLIDQSYADMCARHPDVAVSVIHSGTSPMRVVGDVIKFSREASERSNGEILFVTHSAILRLPYFQRQNEWSLIVDEVPNASPCYKFDTLPRGLMIALRAMPEGAQYSRIEIANKHLIKRVSRGEASAVFAPYRELCNILLSKKWTVRVITRGWKLSSDDRQITFFATLNPDALDDWRSVTVMSACLKDTLLFRVWTAYGVEWSERKAITKRLRSTEHTNGGLLTIHYATERDWSKKLRDAEISENNTNLDEMILASMKLFGFAEHAYMVNVDIAETISGLVTEYSGIQLPNTPHGLNDFQHLNNAVVYSALNLSPAHIKFLGHTCNVSSDEIRCAITYQATYQAALRISLRNPDSSTKKNIVVQDRGCAEYISALFPGSEIALLPTAIKAEKRISKGRSRDVSSAVRKKEFRDEKQLRLAMGVALLHCEDVGSLKSVPHTIDNIPRGTYFKPIGMSVFNSTRAMTASHVIPWTTPDDFINYLSGLHATRYATKEDNKLISPSIFNELSDETRRGRHNITSSIGIWLDNDGGDMTINEFTALFPQLRIVVYNSFKSTAAAPRWRVFIPTTHAMTTELYIDITTQIKQVVEQHGVGYRSEQWLYKWFKRNENASELPYQNHGFDWSKTYPENLMYLPCQAGDTDPNSSFFLDFKDGNRKPLCVPDWIEHSITPQQRDPEPLTPELLLPTPRPEIPANVSDKMCGMIQRLQAQHDAEMNTVHQHRITSAINDWRTCPSGLQNHGYFILGAKLKRFGLELPAIRDILRQESGYAHTPKDRLNQIKSIIDNIRRY